MSAKNRLNLHAVIGKPHGERTRVFKIMAESKNGGKGKGFT